MKTLRTHRDAVIPTTVREAREATGGPEIRTTTLTEVRAVRSDGSIHVTGYAALFDSPSLDMGGWYEVIRRGAFRKVLASGPDVRFLVNHDGLPLARTMNGTLTVGEDTRGLRFDAQLADTSISRDLSVLLERGDINQMSFAFRVSPDGVEWDVDDEGRERRAIIEFLDWDEISVVTFPAYPATTVGVSDATNDDSGDRAQREADGEQAQAADEPQSGHPGDACPESDPDSDDGADRDVRAYRLAAARRRLELLNS